MPTFMKDVPSDALKRSQVDSITLLFKGTAAKALVQVPGLAAPAFLMFDTADQTQATVDALLGTAADVTYATTFGATALGTDACGIVIAHGAVKSLIGVLVTNLQQTTGSPADKVQYIPGNLQDTTALANTLSSKAACTAAGNITIQYLGNSNFDTATVQQLIVEVFYIAK